MNRKEREEEKENFLERMEQYNKIISDEYLEEFRKQEKSFIQKIQNSTVDELVEEELAKVREKNAKKIEFYRSESGKEEVMRTVAMGKKDAEKKQKEDSGFVHIDFYGKAYTYEEVLEKSDEDLTNECIANIINRYQDVPAADLRIIHEHFQNLKEKYDGVKEDELDEYVDLLVQRRKIIYEARLKQAKTDFKNLTDNPLNYESIDNINYSTSVEEGIYCIDSIEDIDEALSSMKQAHKKELRKAIKSGIISSVLGVALGTALVSLSPEPALIQKIIDGVKGGIMVSLPAWTLIGAITGIPMLRNILRNKKIIETLKEEGIYEMFEKRSELDEKIKEYEEPKMNKGSRR